MPFSSEDRSIVQEHMLSIARSDERVTGAALVGSAATYAMDPWSDLDITFGIRTPETATAGPPSTVDALTAILDEWTIQLDAAFGVVHHFDVPSGSAIYRVVLFKNGLELDVSVAPEKDWGARGPNFELLFGTAATLAPSAKPLINDQSHNKARLLINEMIGWGWHHVLHANASIQRGRPWQAEFWISGARDYIIALRCVRCEVPHAHGRGVHLLPIEEVGDLEATLVRSFDVVELQRCLHATTQALLNEIGMQDPSAQLDELAKCLDDFAKRLDNRAS